MKLFALFKMTIREFRRDIFSSILLLALVDLIYANFTGIQLNGESASILWQGGNCLYGKHSSTGSHFICDVHSAVHRPEKPDCSRSAVPVAGRHGLDCGMFLLCAH